MNQFTKALVVTLLGVLCYAVVGAIIVFTSLKWGFSPLSFTMLIIIPVGAIIAGIFGALGFYLATMAFQFRPPAAVWTLIPLAALLTFGGVYYAEYRMDTFQDGGLVAEGMSFTDYMQTQITSAKIGRLGRSSRARVGAFGYVLFGLDILGFLGGAILMAVVIGGLPYCKHCERYFDDVGKKEIFFKSPESLAGFQGRLSGCKPFTKDYAECFSMTSEIDEPAAAAKKVFALMECKQCKAQVVNESTENRKEKDWKRDYDKDVTHTGTMGQYRLTL